MRNMKDSTRSRPSNKTKYQTPKSQFARNGTNCCKMAGNKPVWREGDVTTECVRAICSLRAHWARRLGLWGVGGGLLGTRGVGHTIPAAVGSPSVGKLGQQDMRADLPATHLHCAKSILRPGRGAHIYIRGGGAPHTGVNLRDNRPCEANTGNDFHFPNSPPQRSGSNC